MERFGVTSRKTGETDVETSILIDGEGLASLSTGIGFFDHMLNLLAKHGPVSYTHLTAHAFHDFIRGFGCFCHR